MEKASVLFNNTVWIIEMLLKMNVFLSCQQIELYKC